MRKADFDLILDLVARLGVEEREELKAALENGSDEAVVVELLEARLGAERACPHC